MTSPASPYLGPDEISRTVRRLAHEIVENNRGTDGLVLVGLLSRGYTLARRLAEAIREFENVAVPVGALDIGLYRDDVTRRSAPPPIRPSEIPVSIDGATVVLVDDVLMSGRTLMHAASFLMKVPLKKLTTVVLVDRRHRAFPIRADIVGLTLSTTMKEHISVELGKKDVVHLS